MKCLPCWPHSKATHSWNNDRGCGDHAEDGKIYGSRKTTLPVIWNSSFVSTIANQWKSRKKIRDADWFGWCPWSDANWLLEYFCVWLLPSWCQPNHGICFCKLPGYSVNYCIKDAWATCHRVWRARRTLCSQESFISCCKGVIPLWLNRGIMTEWEIFIFASSHVVKIWEQTRKRNLNLY